MNICHVDNIIKQYNADEIVTPLQNTSLSVNTGDFISIEGTSGIGKSTLLYIMGGLLKPTDGKIFFFGKDLSTLSDRELTNLRSEKIGYIFQDTNLFQALTVKENLAFVSSIHSPKKSKENMQYIDFLLNRLGLFERRNFLPYELSVGQRRRLIIARALLNKPPLILADEPTNDLDNHWSEIVISLLKEVCGNNGAVVMVTHNVHWANEGNIHYILNNGVLSLNS